MKYGKNTKQADGIGKSNEKFDDMIDDPPPDKAAGKGAAGKPGGANVFTKENSVKPDNSCPEGYQLANMSCRIAPSERAVSCTPLYQVGSTAGASCLGAVGCCVPVRDAFLMPKGKDACPIRTCWETAGKEATSCPAAPAAEQAACNVNWGPADWPSVASCPRTAQAVVGAPAAPTGVWAAAACRSYEANVAAWSGDVDLLHRAERTKRIAWETAGQNVACPHVCTHGDEFAKLATSLESLESAMSTARINLPKKKKKCGGALQQAELWARGLASDLRWWVVQPMSSFTWTTDRSNGPYYVWSGINPEPRPYSAQTWGKLCDSLAEHEACMK